jgi:hypothetical protein
MFIVHLFALVAVMFQWVIANGDICTVLRTDCTEIRHELPTCPKESSNCADTKDGFSDSSAF